MLKNVVLKIINAKRIENNNYGKKRVTKKR